MEIETKAIIGICVGIVAWVTKHITNSKKHPCKSDIVFKDVCEAKQDCLENELKNINNRVGELKDDMKNGFDRVENLIRNGG